MVGELDGRLREMVLLLILAFAQRDVTFLAEIVLLISSPGGWSGSMDHAGFRQAIERLVVQYRDLPLQEIQFGPLLEEVTRIAASFELRLPAALVLTSKALAQVQLATAHLDPTLDPFGIAEQFMVRSTFQRLLGKIDPQKLYYDAQKAKFQLFRLFEALEGISGMRPGSHLQVDFRATESLEATILKASKRMAIGLGLGGTIIGVAMVARGGTGQKEKPSALRNAALLLADRSRRRRK
jgi:predicted unusual protein kinase regulating ubiquinone biosynthesis (AarF/ABC1/UbiB family)